MNIGISAELIGEKAGGMETYGYNLVSALADIDSKNQYNIYTVNDKVLRELKHNKRNFHVRYVGTSSRGMAAIYHLPRELYRRPVDLLHITFVPPVVSPSPYVLTIHDLAYRHHPEWFPLLIRYRLQFFLSLGIRKAAGFIAVSKSAKQDLIRFYGVNEERIKVVYEGVNECYHPMEDKSAVKKELRKFGVDGDYILYVGRFHARKNLVRLLEAYDLFRKETKLDLKLVLVGRDMYHGSMIFEKARQLKIEDHIICPGHVEDEVLPLFYNGARLFVYPSLFEGFGLPPLEAAACGTPVLTSNCTSLSEIMGDSAILVDPLSVQEIAENMVRLVTDEYLRKVKIQLGLERASRFTWKETARQTLSVYEDVYARIRNS
jgi:glycosyltransferase involved in cell wall biosynthesis